MTKELLYKQRQRICINVMRRLWGKNGTQNTKYAARVHRTGEQKWGLDAWEHLLFTQWTPRLVCLEASFARTLSQILSHPLGPRRIF